MSPRLVKAAQVAALALPLALMFGAHPASAGVGPDASGLIGASERQVVPGVAQIEDPPGGFGGGEPVGQGQGGETANPANDADSVPNANPGTEPFGGAPEAAPAQPAQTPVAPAAPAAPEGEPAPIAEAPAASEGEPEGAVQSAPAAPAPAAPAAPAPAAPAAPAPAAPADESSVDNVPNAIDPSGAGAETAPSGAPSQPVQGGSVTPSQPDDGASLGEGDLPLLP